MIDFVAVQERLLAALEFSSQADQLVMSYYGHSGLKIELKQDLSPVTAADREAEELLRQRLLGMFPNDTVKGEEFGETLGDSGYRWILDPIDGTKSFVHQVPLFGMLIGLQYQGENVAGICRLPGCREVVYASRGQGAWWQQGDADPVRAEVTNTSALKDSLFCYTAVEGFQQINRIDVLENMAMECRLSRGWGDCYGHMLVATGRADLMIDPLLEEWDACALIPIVEEAGGIFMDWTGRSTAVGGNGISLTPKLKSAVENIIASPRA